MRIDECRFSVNLVFGFERNVGFWVSGTCHVMTWEIGRLTGHVMW